MAKSTTVKYTCECGKSLRLAPDKIGAGLKCPRCQQPIGEGGDEPAPKPGKHKVDDRERGGRRRTTRRVALKKMRKPELDEEEEIKKKEEEVAFEPESEAQEKEAAAPSSARKTSRRKGAATTRADAPERGAGRRSHRSVEGYTTLEKVASFATLFGILLFVACCIVASYFVYKGPAAVMATSAKQAYMYAVMFCVLGMISFIFLYVVGQFARVLLGLVDVIGDLRLRLASSLADDAD